MSGVVQGVGFRPFVHALAARFELAGHVGNDNSGVFIEVEGHADAVEAFCAAVTADAPVLALVEQVTASVVAPTGEQGFFIVASNG
ncbi:MAG: hydrogenase maturation protein HypF, partial [Actinomycetota bacterium]|nr:hydrogenase maturation protein HypF [Actinomycetota bacterium]